MNTKLQEAQALADALSAWAFLVEWRHPMTPTMVAAMETRHLRVLWAAVERVHGRWVS